MAGKVEQFSAEDAFIYTDTYRKAVKMNASTIATEKERLKEHTRRGGDINRSYYAELRGLEHAMNFLVRSEKPKLVLLGETDGINREPAEDKEAKLNARLADTQKILSREKESKDKLKKDLKAVGDAYAKLQAKTMELSQLTVRLTRKVERTSSTFGVIVFAMSVVIIVLLVAISK